MAKHIKSSIRFEIKDVSEQGAFEGHLATYGNIDNGNDLIEKGAFQKTLKERGSVVPLLWQHRADEPVGSLQLEDRESGLYCKGQLLMDLPTAQKAYLLIKSRVVKGLSIGFESIKDAVEGGVRHLKEIKLYEGSIVTFPMNEMAMITGIKSQREQKGDFNQELSAIQLSDACYQMKYALSNALSSCFYSGFTKEQVISASKTVIQQFSDSYMEFLPEYLDLMEQYYGEMETWSKEAMETKSGRTISSANSKVIRAAAESLLALIAEEAGDDDSTSDAKAAKPESEPDESHSAEQGQIDSELKEMLANIEAELKK